MKEQSPDMPSLMLKCLSLNVKGLNLPKKGPKSCHPFPNTRHTSCSCKRPSSVRMPYLKLSNHIYWTAIHATNPDSKTKGVSILIFKHANFQLCDSLIDPEGRYIFLKGSYASKLITLANLYCLNDHQIAFFRKICDLFASFQTGIILLGGDFNVPLNPLLDSSMGTSTLTYKALRQIKLQFQSSTLHDAWCTLFPSDKDYAFFLAPHQKYSRIDYFFLSQSDLPLFQRSTIELMFLSDHHPIKVTLSFPETYFRTKTWPLNLSLLKDPLATDTIRTWLQQYFLENSNPEVSPISLWEAHKCVIRGELIALATSAKRQHQENINNLIRMIKFPRNLSQTDPRTGHLTGLNAYPSPSLEELGKLTRRRYIHGQRNFYEQGNKCGCLQIKKFERFYSKLYNLQPNSTTLNTAETRIRLIKDFLSQYSPKPITP